MNDITLTLAATCPHAHENDNAAEIAAARWANAQRNNVGVTYAATWQRRMRWAFVRGVRGQSRPVSNSNYETPITEAYRAGVKLREALTTLHGPSDEGTGAANPDAIIVPRP